MWRCNESNMLVSGERYRMENRDEVNSEKMYFTFNIILACGLDSS